MTLRETTFCDDARAAQLESEGWHIQRDALAKDHHGRFSPHIAWREIDSGEDEE